MIHFPGAIPFLGEWKSLGGGAGSVSHANNRRFDERGPFMSAASVDKMMHLQIICLFIFHFRFLLEGGKLPSYGIRISISLIVFLL